MLFLHDSWLDRACHEHPFRWLSTAPGELCSLELAEALSKTFPMDGFVRIDKGERTDGKKYRNHSLPYTDATSLGLPAPWPEFIADLSSAGYRSGMARLLGQPIAARLEMRFVRHGPGDWLAPHVDGEDKLFSHVVHLSPEWRDEWGGHLEILDGDSYAVVASVVPDLGASVILNREPNSWHQVAKVSPVSPETRLTFLIHGLGE